MASSSSISAITKMATVCWPMQTALPTLSLYRAPVRLLGTAHVQSVVATVDRPEIAGVDETSIDYSIGTRIDRSYPRQASKGT
jgi:hypothetical protein